MTANSNAAVEAFLAAYCAATNPRNYAVLISAPWGAGKTFFLKGFLKRHQVPHVYVSLYGVTAVSEIEQQIFAQLHPFLSSKGMKIAGLVARAALKGALKIDLNNDGKDDGTLNFSMPEGKLEDFAKSADGRVLVFDDLERALMPTAQILGFINGFVEHADMKAIIAANEDEVDKSAEEYRRIKEKLIGQTLVLVPSASEAFPELVARVEDLWTVAFLNEHQSVVLDIFEKSSSGNLRVLRQALWDFERFATTLRATDIVHDLALLEILKATISLSIEVRLGRLAETDLQEIKTNRFARLFGANKDRSDSKFDLAEERYVGVDMRQPFVDTDVMTKLLIRGHADAAEVHESLDRTPPFIPAQTEVSWRRVWRGWELTESEFESAIGAFEKDIADAKFDEPGEVLHVFGLLVQTVEIDRPGYSFSSVKKTGKAYVDHLAAAGRIRFPTGKPRSVHTESGYGGLGFFHTEAPTFVALRRYYEQAIIRAWEANLPQVAGELMRLLESDPEEFAEAVSIGNGGNSRYWNVPVLHHIDPNEFVRVALNARPNMRGRILQALGERLARPDAVDVQAAEKPWLRKVRKKFNAALPQLGDMSRFMLRKQIAEHLSPVLKSPKVT